MLDSNLTGVIIVGIVALIPITIVSVTKITNYRLKVEQIKADTVVKVEEAKARNQLEIEKLMIQDKSQAKEEPINRTFVISGDEELLDDKKQSSKMKA